VAALRSGVVHLFVCSFVCRMVLLARAAAVALLGRPHRCYAAHNIGVPYVFLRCEKLNSYSWP